MNSPSPTTRAACLTAPAMGGVAIVQVVGRDAPALLTPMLRAKRPLDLATLPPGELRLCRFYDGEEIIDEAIVSVRHNREEEPVIDISLHGGPRIVQRVMLRLKQAGIAILEANEAVDHRRQPANAIEQEALDLLLRVKTRAVASWLIQLKDWLTAETQSMIANVQAGQVEPVRETLHTLVHNHAKLKYLIEGMRVVLVGEPNVGKSTLANALTDREQAIVSDIPGTTRDFIEYPAAAEGLPLTIVDTAGVRDSSDALEQEAIRRTLQQVQSADVLVRVLDASDPADTTPPAANEIVVWNKCDLKKSEIGNRKFEILLVSALTGQGLNDLRRRLLQVHALSDWHNLKMCFTPRQMEISQRTLSALGREPDPDVIAMLNRFSNSFR